MIGSVSLKARVFRIVFKFFRRVSFDFFKGFSKVRYAVEAAHHSNFGDVEILSLF